MRSSWRCNFSSSPETRAPPSRLRFRKRVNRSRNLSSWSVAIRGEEPEESCDVRLQLGPRQDRVDVTEAEVLLGETEVLRQLLARRLLNHSWTCECKQSTGLGNDHVTQARKAREHA